MQSHLSSIYTRACTHTHAHTRLVYEWENSRKDEKQNIDSDYFLNGHTMIGLLYASVFFKWAYFIYYWKNNNKANF